MQRERRGASGGDDRLRRRVVPVPLRVGDDRLLAVHGRARVRRQPDVARALRRHLQRTLAQVLPQTYAPPCTLATAVLTNGHTGHVPRAPDFFRFDWPPTGCGEIIF